MNVTGTRVKDVAKLKKILPAEDILTFDFQAENGLSFTLVFADAVTDKELLGDEVVRPLLKYEGEKTAQAVKTKFLSPEVRTEKAFSKLAEEVLAGNPVLLWEGADEGIIVGTKKVFTRAIAEPSTDVVVKGPREGFIEDVKTNTSLIRRRLKTPELKIEYINVGKRSTTAVALCYLEGTSVRKTVEEVKQKLQAIEIDIVADSSYVTHFLASRPIP